MSERRALFTASSFGNTSATSGLSTTIFDDLRSRSAYFPRTKPSGKSERSYSGRKSSLSIWLFFFIDLSLSFARNERADDSKSVIFFSVSHYRQSTPFKDTKGYEPFFPHGMVRVVARCCHRVLQSCCGFLERYLMFPQIRASLLCVPFESHTMSLTEQHHSALNNCWLHVSSAHLVRPAAGYCSRELHPASPFFHLLACCGDFYSKQAPPVLNAHHAPSCMIAFVLVFGSGHAILTVQSRDA